MQKTFEEMSGSYTTKGINNYTDGNRPSMVSRFEDQLVIPERFKFLKEPYKTKKRESKSHEDVIEDARRPKEKGNSKNPRKKGRYSVAQETPDQADIQVKWTTSDEDMKQMFDNILSGTTRNKDISEGDLKLFCANVRSLCNLLYRAQHDNRDLDYLDSL